VPFTSGILWFGYLTSGLVYPNGFATLALLRVKSQDVV
jgi:hypothetical protein